MTQGTILSMKLELHHGRDAILAAKQAPPLQNVKRYPKLLPFQVTLGVRLLPKLSNLSLLHILDYIIDDAAFGGVALASITCLDVPCHFSVWRHEERNYLLRKQQSLVARERRMIVGSWIRRAVRTLLQPSADILWLQLVQLCLCPLMVLLVGNVVLQGHQGH